jgi:hypothetical protein
MNIRIHRGTGKHSVGNHIKTRKGTKFLIKSLPDGGQVKNYELFFIGPKAITNYNASADLTSNI